MYHFIMKYICKKPEKTSTHFKTSKALDMRKISKYN